MRSPWKAKRRKRKSAATATQIVTIPLPQSPRGKLVHKFGDGEEVEVEESDDEPVVSRSASSAVSAEMCNDGELVTQLVEMQQDLTLHERQLRRLRGLAQSADDTKRLHMIDVGARKCVKQRQEVCKMQSKPFVDPDTFAACEEAIKGVAASQMKLCGHFAVEYPPEEADYTDPAYDENGTGSGGRGSKSAGSGGGGASTAAAAAAEAASIEFLTQGFAAQKYSQNGKKQRRFIWVDEELECLLWKKGGKVKNKTAKKGSRLRIEVR
jgi:hypothetical protein